MPPLKILHRLILSSSTLFFLTYINAVNAVEYEIMPIAGYTFSPNLDSGDHTTSLSTTDEPNFGLAFSWQDSPTGQGQVLVNYISRDFTENTNQTTQSFDTIYAHFNGVALFKERNYITSVGFGIGGTYFDSDYDSGIYPSITASLGTRYEFSNSLALITELRLYATLTDEDESVFCDGENCIAHFDSAVWLDSQISIGLAYRF